MLLTSEPDGGKWKASRLGRFTSPCPSCEWNLPDQNRRYFSLAIHSQRILLNKLNRFHIESNHPPSLFFSSLPNIQHMNANHQQHSVGMDFPSSWMIFWSLPPFSFSLLLLCHLPGGINNGNKLITYDRVTITTLPLKHLRKMR